MGGFQKGLHLDYVIYEWSLRDVFESKYINKTPTKEEKIISRNTGKIVYNSEPSNGEAFLNVIKNDNGCTIFALKKKGDLLKVMETLRKNLQYGLFTKSKECQIASQYLSWFKSYKV